MAELPRGTVTFLFTDIEGSTRRWERDAAAMGPAVERHFALLREAAAAHGGAVFRTVGDAVQAAFPTAPAALADEGATRQAIGHGCGGVGMTVHGAPPSGGDLSMPVRRSGPNVASAG